jgi:hypothetical protein
MNERIRELVKQAGGHFTKHNLMSNPIQHRESIELWDKNIEKFAELIVLECAQVCLSQRDPANLNYKPSVKFAEAVKHHFGVKE